MEPVLFYGVPMGCSLGSIAALELLDEPYYLSRVQLPADHGNQDYARLSPAHEIPVLLLEDNRVLPESIAILQHLAARNLSKPLGYRQGTDEFDRLNQILAVLAAGFHPFWWPVFHPERFADPAAGTAGEDFVKSKAIAVIADRYARIDALLAGRKWLASDRLSVADLYFYGIMRWGFGVFDMEKTYPRVFNHQQRLSQQPAIKFALAIENQEPAKTSGKFLGHVSLEELRPRFAA